MSQFETFGERLLEAAKLRGCSLAMLSDQMLVKEKRLYAYAVNRDHPLHKTLVGIASALDVSIDYLCCASDEPRRLFRKPFMSAFPTRLREARLDRGLTQEKLAEMIGAKREKVSFWENGGHPGFWTLQETAKKLDVSIDWLCGLTDERKY